ncbi:hypothetical protein [Desertivirga xinjiangensis]|uniref:hypothetical protein n=1 Tax=Desertivirga xinjiangensis TaxID=539206 RepID=UPI00210C4892|nr:hypothetical protein [Pedobacter xinjiangensis]
MEQFLPLIIGLAFFVYKTYSNYKTEQEKTRKRNISQARPQDPEAEPLPSKAQDTAKPKPFLYDEKRDTPERYEPQYKNPYKEPMVKPALKEESYQRMQSEVYPEAEPYYREKPAEETIKNRKIHASHKHANAKVKHEEEHPAYEFDMKDAIIKEAILNRPKF